MPPGDGEKKQFIRHIFRIDTPDDPGAIAKIWSNYPVRRQKSVYFIQVFAILAVNLSSLGIHEFIETIQAVD